MESLKGWDSHPWGCSSVGRAPAPQAGGQEFESLHLHLVLKEMFNGVSGMPSMYLENCILKYLEYFFFGVDF